MEKIIRSTLIATIILSLLISGISCKKRSTLTPTTPPEPASAEEVSPTQTPSTTPPQKDYTNPLITGADWNNMTLSQKEAWVDTALDAMMAGGELEESERQPAIYYVEKLDEVFYEPVSETRLVAWELTTFTSSTPAIESTPSVGTTTKFAQVSLLPITNSSIAWKNPPLGEQVFAGIPFHITKEKFNTQGHSSHTESPVEANLQVNLSNPQNVCVLVGTTHTWTQFSEKQVGEITLVFDDGSTQVTRLIVGQNVREYIMDNRLGATVNTLTDSAAQSVWQGVNWDGRQPTTLDMLTIAVTPSNQGKMLKEIIITDTSTTTASSASPGIGLFGITVEYLGEVLTSDTTQTPAPVVIPPPTQTSAPLSKHYFLITLVSTKQVTLTNNSNRSVEVYQFSMKYDFYNYIMYNAPGGGTSYGPIVRGVLTSDESTELKPGQSFPKTFNRKDMVAIVSCSFYIRDNSTGQTLTVTFPQ